MDLNTILTDGRMFLNIYCVRRDEGEGGELDRDGRALVTDIGEALSSGADAKEAALERLRTLLAENFGEPSADSGLRERWARRLVADVGTWMTVR